MVTGSSSKMVQLWDMKKAIVLKELEGHDGAVSALAVSKDGQLIASGDQNGEVIAWDANIGVSLSKTIPAHVYKSVTSLDFCPDGSMLATAGANGQIKLFSTKTWNSESENLHHLRSVRSGCIICVRYSPSGELLAIATSGDIQIYNTRTRTRVINFEAHSRDNISLAWMPDGTRLFSAGGRVDPSIREWDPSTWKQVGGPWNGHLKPIDSISLNSSGTLLASASQDKCVRIWRLSESDQRTIDSEFKHELPVSCVTFSADDRHILSSSGRTISEWPLSKNAITEDDPKDVPKDVPKDFLVEQVTDQAHAHSDFEVFAMNPNARDACIALNLPTAEKVLNEEIDADSNNYISYANRALIMARKCDWDRALLDSIKSVSIQPSFTGHVSKGIALCGKGQVRAANTAFDLASVFTNGDLKISHFLYLIKTISLFNANEHEEAMLRIGELAVSPNVDIVACRIVETYLRIQLGMIALRNACHSEAIDHFNAAVNASASFHQLAIHSTHKEFIVLFGWNLKSLWQTAIQQQCRALIRAGRIGAAVESYQSLMDKSDESTKASLRAWFSDLK